MKRPDRRHALWLLDEADRLDRRAAELEDQPTPAPVADIAAMTQEWVEATLGADHLRATARHLRSRAATIARTDRSTRP